MTDLAQGQAAGPGSAISSPLAARSPVPSPASIRPRQQAAAADSGRATARAVLGDALSGVDLTAAERRFLTRLSHWDKRNATLLASLLARARQVGRQEARAGAAVLGPDQLEVVLAALMDAFAYRTDQGPGGCWDCATPPGQLCAVHAGDAERARAFADLAAVLSAKVTPAGLSRLDSQPGFRHEAAFAS